MRYDITFTLNRDAKITGQILRFNTSEVIVQFRTNVDKPAGANTMYWDGKDKDGVLVPPAPIYLS